MNEKHKYTRAVRRTLPAHGDGIDKSMAAPGGEPKVSLRIFDNRRSP